MNTLKVLAIFLLGTQLALAGVLNGDFSSNLNDWQNSNVSPTSGVADLNDSTGTDSRLYQGVVLSSGQYLVEFDFQNQISADVAPGGFLDTFFASLYFINDIANFDLDNLVFDDSLALFDLAASGPVPYIGSIGSSALGGGWQHYSGSFSNTANYAIPTFELFNLNGINQDSHVLIDNVAITAAAVITPVPEPTTLALLLLMLPGLIRIKADGVVRKAFWGK